MNKRILERYITRMLKYENICHIDAHKMGEYTFYGDGCGDFEEIADDASEELVLQYIKHCEEQIKIAKEYLLLQKR